MMKMKKTTCGILAAVAVLATAAGAGAQVCAGFPIRDGQGSIHALANFPSGFDQYGVEGAYNFTGPLSINGGYIRSSGGGDHLDTFRAGAALDITPYVAAALPGISVCPNVRADFTSQDDVNFVTVPIGLGLGASLPVGGPDMTLTPFVIPALVWSHASASGLPSVNETDFGIRGGADLNFDRFYLGGVVEWIDTPGNDAVFGVRAGIKF